MSVDDELVARYDAEGHQVGSAWRREVRAHGIWHGAGVALVRSADGTEVYVHRRVANKDVYPGMWDCWTGGVVAADEAPADCVIRELAEELGISGVSAEPLFVLHFEEPPVRCHKHTYEVRWPGPVRHQPEEIAEGGWMTLAALRAMAEDPDSELVPDGRLAIKEWFRRYG